ncbi:punA [Symbiodinium sp. CCMP2592]|nr:punA [Symbiodinium sp. CCMP2592]
MPPADLPAAADSANFYRWPEFLAREPPTTIGIVLGSGLGDFANDLEDPIYLNYSDIPAFPVSTVEGHAGRFVHGYLHGVPVLMMQGRVHLYEGYTAHESAFPVRVMNNWGIRTLLLTNAAGGINKNFPTGDLMLIADHINLLFQNPCVGRNDPKLPRFFPMNDAYSPRLRKIVQEIDPEVRSGVYAAMLGPNYETPAEIRMLRLLGVDAVGMSTVNECIAARHLGLEVVGFSVITNATVDEDLSEEKVEHSEVVQVGKAAGPRLRSILLRLIPQI